MRVPVALIEKGQQRPETRTDGRGIARLCEAPLRPVDIAVGVDLCGSVLLRHVQPNWPEVRRVFVIYQGEPCERFAFADRCLTLLRVTTENGSPVPGARLEGGGTVLPGSMLTDAFGRLFVQLKRGESLLGMIVKEGRQPVRISERCASLGEDYIEDTVVLPR
jgi:hypothetical protein